MAIVNLAQGEQMTLFLV